MADVVDLEIPKSPWKDYLLIFGVAAVYVAAMSDGRVITVGVSRDLEKSLNALRASKGDIVDIAAAYWVHERADAVRLAMAVTDYKDADGHVTVERARRAIEYVAKAKGIGITNHDVAYSRVKAAVDRIDERIDRAQSAGQLKLFNQAFRAYRVLMKQSGQKAMKYFQARAALRRALVKQLVTGSKVDIGEGVVAEVFSSKFEEFSVRAD